MHVIILFLWRSPLRRTHPSLDTEVVESVAVCMPPSPPLLYDSILSIDTWCVRALVLTVLQLIAAVETK